MFLINMNKLEYLNDLISQTVEFYSSNPNFSRKIKSTLINIIDYLQTHREIIELELNPDEESQSKIDRLKEMLNERTS
jgi:hypothetical protein